MKISEHAERINPQTNPQDIKENNPTKSATM